MPELDLDKLVNDDALEDYNKKPSWVVEIIKDDKPLIPLPKGEG